MPSLSEKKCLVVFGMHRSGTSALSGALSIAGLNPGKELFDPAEDNPKGYFENARVTTLNEKIFRELYTRWNDSLLIPDAWWDFDKFGEYFEQLVKILEEELAENKTMLIKDPRLCVLLPFYLKAFRQLNIAPSFVICSRNPMEIAASLEKRNHLPLEKSLLLWMDHLLKAEFHSREFPRLFISYYDFLREPIGILNLIEEKLNPGLVLTEETENKISEFLDPGLRHHHLQNESPGNIPAPGLKEFCTLIEAANGRDLNQQEIEKADRIREAFYGGFRFFRGLSEDYRAALEVQFTNGKKAFLQEQVKYGRNCLEFQIPDHGPVKRFVFKPSNSRICIEPEKTVVTGTDGTTSEMLPSGDNAGFRAEGRFLLFETDMPQIDYKPENPVTFTTLTFHFICWAFGEKALLMGLHLRWWTVEVLNSGIKVLEENKVRLTSELEKSTKLLLEQEEEARSQRSRAEELERKVADLEQHIDTMTRSLTWKTGSLITYIPRKLTGLIKNK